MSNGVEVIVATDRSARPLEPEFLRFLSSTVTRPITLAPHTLSNLMSMVLSSEQIPDDHNRFIALIQPTFTTKTYYTTYSYKTTTLRNNSTVVTNTKMTVTNVKTEPRCKVTESEHVELVKTTFVSVDASPTLKTEVYNTEYTFLNTFLDGDQPFVMSATQTISNTVIGLHDDLEPSEVFPSTNTYYKTVELTKTLTDHRIISTSDVVTQVVVTDKPVKKSTEIPITTNVTKTYFVTYTYFSTYLVGDQTKVKSDVSVSSDVTIEKFYIKPKKTETVAFERTTKTNDPIKPSSMIYPFNLMATRTYLTTFTYFTTLLHGTDRNAPETKINSRTKVVENTMAEAIPHGEFNTDYLQKLNSSLQTITGSIITTATLKKGETILVTAYRDSILKSSYQKYEIKPTKTQTNEGTLTKWMEVQEIKNPSHEIAYSAKTSLSPTNTQITLIKPTKTVISSEPLAEALIAEQQDKITPSKAPTAEITISPSLSSPVSNEYYAEANVDDLRETSNETPQDETAATANEESLNEETEAPIATEKNTATSPTVNQTNVNGLLNFTQLGINGMNVLGPVFNVMAELINNKMGKHGDGISRRNDSIANKPEHSSNNVNPILSFVNKFTSAPTKPTTESEIKPTTSRTPVYIPVGSFGHDTDGGENQNRRVLITRGSENWYEKWQDIHGKNLEKIRPNDNPVTILEGGIPISPGQVITTNSDVIIGRPGGTGPRPPNIALNSNIPVNMKPPPVPPSVVPAGDGDHYIGQPSTNTGVNYPFVKDELNMKPPPPGLQKPLHDAQSLKIARPYLNAPKDYKVGPHLVKNSHSNKNSNTKYDSGILDLNPPPVPPPPMRAHDVHKPITINHKPVHESHVGDHPHPDHDHHYDHHHDHHDHNLHTVPIKLEENYLSSSDLNPTILTFPTLPVLGPVHHGNIPLITTPTPHLDSANVASVLLVPTVGDISLNPNVVDRSTGHPFLVNIQPSQVANIVIPHGSSTALIVNDGNQHSLKGEVIDDPKPHPEPETVGFIGAEPVLKLENDDLTTVIHNEVIAAETIDAPKTSSHVNGILQSLSHHSPVNPDLLKPIGDVLVANAPFPSAQTPLRNIEKDTQFVQQSQTASHQSSTAFDHHSQVTSSQNGGKLENHIKLNQILEGQNAGGLILNHNVNFIGHNYGKRIVEEEVAQNYRKEANANGGSGGPLLYNNAQGTLNSQSNFGEMYYKQIQTGHNSGPHNYPLNTDNLYPDQIRFKQGQKLENEGVYLAVPPPDRPDVSHQGGHGPTLPHSAIKESLINHQSGIVSDVPLAQVLSGSDQKDNTPLKDLLIKYNSNNGDSIGYDPKVTTKFHEGSNSVKRPANDFDQDLSPPPPPHRPAFVPPHQKLPQRYRPHPHQSSQPVPTPLEFMIPPPETPNRLKLKPQPEQHPRPVIPIGAIEPSSNYPQQRPEDMVIVPQKNRPGFVEHSFVNAIKHKHQIPANSQVYYDLDVSDSTGSITMEKGEEMQESILQPMFPTPVINDVMHFNKNYTLPSKNQKITPPNASEIFRNHTLSGDGAKITIGTENKNHNFGLSTNNQRLKTNRTDQNKPSLVADSSHGSSNIVHVIGHQQNRHPNHKDLQNILHNHQQEGAFNSLKISPGTRRPIGSHLGASNRPFGFNGKTQNNATGTGTVIRVPKPNIHPSGFVKNEINTGSRPNTYPDDLHKSESSQNILTTNAGIEKDGKKPAGYSPTQTISRDPYFGGKEKITNSTKNQSQRPKDSANISKVNEHHKGTSSSAGNEGVFDNQNKNPAVYGGSSQLFEPSNPIYGSKIHPPAHPHIRGPGSRPHNNSAGSLTQIKNNRNKIAPGHSIGTNGPSQSTNVQKRPYLPFESFSQGNTKLKRPSIPPPAAKGDASTAETGEVPTIDLKNVSNEGSYTKHSTVSGGLPPAFVPANESTSSLTNAAHNYRNKTINFYNSKPSFDVSNVHKSYNKVALEADKWFGSSFNNNNNNNNHNYNNTKLPLGTSLTSAGSYKNVTQLLSITPIGQEDQITLMTPPKATEVKTKLDDVMGLSPPPLQRPLRPQAPHRPQRPKPHLKFEPSTTHNPPTAPIAIENDFPPVRSPDFNRKPFKPQDIFPPRLPDNFVHHLPGIRGPPKPNIPERPVTSLPIDVPTSENTDDDSAHSYEISDEFEDNSGKYDPFFAGSEINGHSKPIFDEDKDLPIVVRPPPTSFSSNKEKPVLPNKPFGTQTQTSGLRTTERKRPESTDNQIKHTTTISSIRDGVSPTPTISAQTTKTHSTKISASVTPTTTRPHKEWQDADIITGSETAFESDQFTNHVTPDINSVTKNSQVVTNFVNTGSKTIFAHQSTQQPNQVSKNKSKPTLDPDSTESQHKIQKTTSNIVPNIVPTQTTTLTVTTTMTTVVHSVGHKPSTKTIVLTKTLISTVINKVTETKTLVKPTTSTLYQTHTVSTTKTSLVMPTALHPTQAQYPSGTLKPEIFVADPHAKDTMTISVSSSMNKNNHKFDQKVRPVGITGKDTIMVVISNDHSHENQGSDDMEDENSDKVEVSDEENEVIHSRVVVGGVFDAEVDKEFKESSSKEDECFPSCKAKKNELCQRIKGVMKCVCRPGFARMFPDRPCRPTYTYEVKLALEKLGSEELQYGKNVAQSNSAHMTKLMSVTKEGLDRMIMQSELRDVYHGLVVNGFQGKEKKTMVDFYVQLSENTDEEKLVNIFKETLQTSNYSLGGTELFAAREADNLDAEDFNECLNPKYHDCSEHARCFNLKGTYTCSCQEGYTDMSENTLFPGRVCSDAIGCEYCGYHGACYSKGEGQITCECFQWYSGERCNINLKVLLIALATIGVILLALLLVCGVLTCINRRNKSSSSTRNNGYLRYRGPSSHSIDRRAMISDSSSESSVDNLPYLSSPPMPNPEMMAGKKKAVLRHVKGPVSRTLPPPGVEQRDRSVTVMIPRAKYRPPPHLSPHLTMSTFSPEKHLPKAGGQIATEQKLISYLDGNIREERSIVNTKNQSNRQDNEQLKAYDFKITSVANANEQSKTMDKKKDPRMFEYEYKMSNMSFSEETHSADRRSGKHLDDRFRRHSDSTHLHTDSHRAMQFRKYSAGALVSAGYEVSAKVGMHQLEDDTMDDDQSGITNTHTMKSNRSQFTTLNRTGDHKTMSEARSYDETTVHPQTRSLKTNYSGSSPSSRANNDEGHTMIERDLGSTFIMPESQLFKPEADRGSDISNFDSL